MPISFLPDLKDLKAKFYANNRKYHPDFYTLKSEEEQQMALEKSILNNKAYKTLSNFNTRLQYILKLFEVIKDEDKGNKIPQSFLMDMMDINEVIMELEFDFDPIAYKATKDQVEQIQSESLQEAEQLMKSFDVNTPDQKVLEALKDYYFKGKYLTRIQENLDKFAEAL